MDVRIMILPYGDTLVGKKQEIGYSDILKWHIFWISKDGDKMVSERNLSSKKKAKTRAKKHNWDVD